MFNFGKDLFKPKTGTGGGGGCDNNVELLLLLFREPIEGRGTGREGLLLLLLVGEEEEGENALEVLLGDDGEEPSGLRGLSGCAVFGAGEEDEFLLLFLLIGGNETGSAGAFVLSAISSIFFSTKDGRLNSLP